MRSHVSNGRTGFPGCRFHLRRHGLELITEQTKEAIVIHELRIYHCVPGRLPALLNRFDTITLKLWEKHGIRQAGFWTMLVGDSNQDLYYLLEWESLAEREEKWNKFAADPEWLEKRAETEKDGQIVAKVVNYMLQPTSFSSVK